MSIIILIAVIIVAALIETAIYDKHWADGLRVRIGFGSNKAVEGGSTELVEVIEHSGRLPLPWLTVKFQASRDLIMPDSSNASVTDYYYREDIFAVSPGKKITRRLPIKCARRGLQSVRSFDLITNDIFLVRRYIKNYAGSSQLVVYPRPVDISELSFEARRIMGDYVVKRSLLEDVFVFRGIREYMEGDSLNKINWRATAKNDKLVINQHEATTSLSATIFLDVDSAFCNINEMLIEESISIAASIANDFIASGIPVGLVCNGRDCVTGEETMISSGCSPQHADSISTALARLDIQKGTRRLHEITDIISAEPQMFAVIISSDTSRKQIEFVKKMLMDSGEALWVIPVPCDERVPLDVISAVPNHYVWRVNNDR